MIMKSLFATLFASIALSLSTHVLAAYQYTYTSGPNAYLDYSVVNGPGIGLTPDSLFQIVITSSTLLTPTTDLLGDATLTFSLADYSLTATYSEVEPPELNFTFVEITEFDANNLPAQWSFEVQRVIALEPGNESVYNFISNPLFNLFIASSGDPANTFNAISSYPNTGNWTLSEISSPVSENETYAMMLAGLGVVGVFGCRKRKEANFLKKSPRTKRHFSIRRFV